MRVVIALREPEAGSSSLDGHLDNLGQYVLNTTTQ